MFRFLAAGALVALLAACATPPPAMPPDSVPDVDQFELTGRVAVKLEGRGYSARLRWLHQIDADAIWLYSPVGSTIATLYADRDIATLVTSRKETYQSEDVQGLTRDVLGWDLPLPGLKHWVLGRIDPEVPVDEIQQDEQMRITRLAQGGWHIDYVGYQDDGSLPASMVLRFDDLRMRLVIDRWNGGSLAQ